MYSSWQCSRSYPRRAERDRQAIPVRHQLAPRLVPAGIREEQHARPGRQQADKLMAIDRRPRTRWQISAMRLGPDARQKIVSPLNNQA